MSDGNIISLKVKILEEKDNEIVGQVVKKEAFTYPDPKVGQNYYFFGTYNKDQFQVGETVIIRSEYAAERRDPSRIEMTIEKIEKDHFDPGGADLDMGILGVVIGVILVFSLIFRRIKKK